MTVTTHVIRNGNEQKEYLVTLDSKDQNWQDETTTYWFKVGANSRYGVAECGPDKTVLSATGEPINTDDHEFVWLEALKPLTEHYIDD